jgi:hypothetical protein
VTQEPFLDFGNSDPVARWTLLHGAVMLYANIKDRAKTERANIDFFRAVWPSLVFCRKHVHVATLCGPHTYIHISIHTYTYIHHTRESRLESCLPMPTQGLIMSSGGEKDKDNIVILLL